MKEIRVGNSLRRPLVLTITAAIVVWVLSSAAARAATAQDGPGFLSHFDLARKDCLGTAENTSSKVWFTIANGVLSDVYYPTNDNTNVETLQYVVTDGSTFTDIQTRDTTYTVQLLDSRALDCRVTATAKSGKYRIITGGRSLVVSGLRGLQPQHQWEWRGRQRQRGCRFWNG